MVTIYRYRTFDRTFQFYSAYFGKGNIDNVPHNFTGQTIRAQVREKRGKNGNPGKVILNLNPVAAVPTNGKIRIQIPRDITRALKNSGPDELEWDIVGLKADGTDFWIRKTAAIQIVTPSTDPDNVGNGQMLPSTPVNHTHPISQVIGLQQALDDLHIWEDTVTEANINADDELVIIKAGIEFYVPLFRR